MNSILILKEAVKPYALKFIFLKSKKKKKNIHIDKEKYFTFT